MDSKGLMLDLSTLRRELREKKSARARIDPVTERMKRAASPTLLDRRKLMQEMTAFVPTSPRKKNTWYHFPANRKELVAQYPKRLDLSAKKPVPSYQRDAASFLVRSLEKHYFKFFYVWKQHAVDLRKAQIRIETLHQHSIPTSSKATDVPPRPSDEVQVTFRPYPKDSDPFSTALYSDVQDDHVAVISNISHADLETPLPVSPRKAVALVSALSRAVYKQQVEGFSGIYLAQSRNPAERRGDQLDVESQVVALVASIQKAAVRPCWETLRNEAVKSMVCQLFAVSVQKLASVCLPAVQRAFSRLKGLKTSHKPRKPGITLKTAVQRVIQRRLQAAFGATKRFVERQQVKCEYYHSRLARCLLLFDLARIKVLAKFFSRLRLRPVQTGKAETLPRSRVSVGLRVITHVLAGAESRCVRDCVEMLRSHSEALVRRDRKLKAAASLVSALRQLRLRYKEAPFRILHKDFNSAELLRIGKAVMLQLQQKYQEALRYRLQSNFEKWHCRAQKPSAMSNPEAPRVAKILQRQVTERVKWGFRALMKLLPEKPKVAPIDPGKKAAAAVLGLLLSRAVQCYMKQYLDSLHREEPTRIERSSAGGKAAAVKVIVRWDERIGKKRVQAVLGVWRRRLVPLRLQAGLRQLGCISAYRRFRDWKLQSVGLKSVTRGSEILVRLLRRKLGRALRRLEPFQTDHSVSVSRPAGPGWSLRIALQTLRRRQMVQKQKAVGGWRLAAARQRTAEQKKWQSAAAALLAFAEVVRAQAVSIQKSAFGRLLTR